MGLDNELRDGITKLAPEIYKDLVKPTAQEIGCVAGRSAKALLSPVRVFLWGWEKIEDIVVTGVNKRLEGIPEERRKIPDPEIAVPLIQALSYTAQNEKLREMYLNLLANSMDSSMEKSVHPSFVELIKQMNSLDANVFQKLASVNGYQQAISPEIVIASKLERFFGATPDWFVGWTIHNHDIFDVSSSIVRLSKFGLVELIFDKTIGNNQAYLDLTTHQELITIFERYKAGNPTLELEILATKCVFYVNEYGRQFKNSCI